MTAPTRDSIWRVRESRRMIDDARALVSFAEGLKEWDRPNVNDAERPPRAASPEGARTVLVHAVSIIEGEVERTGVGEASAPPGPQILVLLDDAPAVPDFLPEGAELDLDDPTEEAVRSAIERRVRGALNRTPAQHHILDLVESIQDAVIVIDRRCVIAYLNTSAVSLLQTLTRRTGPFVGGPLAAAFPPASSPTLRPAIQNALVHADATRVEDPERHRGLAFGVAVFPNPQGATLLIRDITKRKDTEAELIDARVRLARAESRLRARDDEAPV